MAQSAREFFESLDTRIDPAKLEGQSVSYRFDLADAGSWHVVVAHGELTVVEGSSEADCVFVMKEEVFLKLLRGEQNATTAFMMGRIKVEGDMSQALKLKDLFL